MPQNRALTGVAVVSVMRKDHRSGHRRKHRRERSIKVTPVNRNSSSKNKMVNLVHQNDDTNIDQELKSSDEINLEEPINTLIPFDPYESGIMPSVSVHPSVTEMSELSVAREMNIAYPRLITATKDKRHALSTRSSLNKSCSLFDNNDTSFDLLRTNSIKEYQKQPSKRKSLLYENPTFEKRSKKSTEQFEITDQIIKKQRRRICKLCPACSNCCCFASAIGLLLLLAGLAALLIYLFTNKHITTTTSTSSTTSTTATTTTSTSTTSTTSTSSSTSTTSTSTSTTSTTSTTSVTTTTVTTTSSTSSTSTSTTTTTPAPPCIPTSVGSSSTIYSTTSGSASSYTCHAYTWTSPTTGVVTLAFTLRQDPDLWYLDDVSVYGGGIQMLINGGFETGSLTPWVRTTPNGNCAGTAGQVSSSTPHSGTYSLIDGSYLCADEISQQFMATAGQVYVVSFWLQSGSTGSVITALVTLS